MNSLVINLLAYAIQSKMLVDQKNDLGIERMLFKMRTQRSAYHARDGWY